MPGKKQPKPEKKVKMSRGARNGLIAVVFISLFAISMLSWMNYQTASQFNIPTAPTTYIVNINDVFAPSNTEDFEADIAYQWFECDVFGMEQAEIDALTMVDFTAVGADNNEMDPDTTAGTDNVYILKCNGTDIVERWFSTDARLTFGEDSCPLDLLVLGENEAYMANATEDISISVKMTETGGVTFAGATEAYWDVSIYMLDATEASGETTTKEGFMSYFDVDSSADDITLATAGYWTGLALECETNETTSAAFSVIGTYKSVAEDPISDGTEHNMVMLKGAYTGVTTVQIKLKAALIAGTADYAITEVMAVGTAAGLETTSTFTQYDEQA
jgi:hypothetical protein